MHTPTFLTAILTATLGVACLQTDQPDDELSKDEARHLQKADGLDYCELQGWYGDDICDEFCLYPDPDCAGECPDVCEAICAGEPEPDVPAGCPVPMCECPQESECPDVCEAICAGEPEPDVPAGCPVPSCQCSE